METVIKNVLLTELSLDMSSFYFINAERYGTDEELETLKKWIKEGKKIKMTLTSI